MQTALNSAHGISLKRDFPLLEMLFNGNLAGRIFAYWQIIIIQLQVIAFFFGSSVFAEFFQTYFPTLLFGGSVGVTCALWMLFSALDVNERVSQNLHDNDGNFVWSYFRKKTRWHQIMKLIGAGVCGIMSPLLVPVIIIVIIFLVFFLAKYFTELQGELSSDEEEDVGTTTLSDS